MMATTNLLVRLNRCRMKSSCRSKTTIEDTSRILRSRLSPTRDHRPRSGPPSQRSRNPPDPTLPRPSAISPIPMGRSSSTTPPMAGTTAARRLRLPADRDPWSPLQVTVYMAAPAEHGTKAGYSFPDTPKGIPKRHFPSPIVPNAAGLDQLRRECSRFQLGRGLCQHLPQRGWRQDRRCRRWTRFDLGWQPVRVPCRHFRLPVKS